MSRVVYLFGAGASHGAVKARKSAYGILMRDISLELIEGLRTLVYRPPFSGHDGLKQLINNVIDENTDFEHVITFLDQSASAVHRHFAEELRATFESVLRRRLDTVQRELDGSQSDLYLALLDMYQVRGVSEVLHAVLTLNYDEFLEEAVARLGAADLNFGIDVGNAKRGRDQITVLKLHGSFGWDDVWPIRRTTGERALWIAPGIRKEKQRYPFNLIWGHAQEVLDCDVLRVVGCQLGPNDWDLISLLFNTKHVRSSAKPYRIEIIDHPMQAIKVRSAFPYLEVVSIFELERIGNALAADLLPAVSRPFTDLDPSEQEDAVKELGQHNWFLIWLNSLAEDVYHHLGDVSTRVGAFEELLTDYV